MAKGPMIYDIPSIHEISYEDGNAIQAPQLVSIHKEMEHVLIGVKRGESPGHNSTEIPTTTEGALKHKLSLLLVFIYIFGF